MHLISPLISGVRNADNGSARIVRRGTVTRATLYSSFEGDSFSSSALDGDGDVVLDSYGRAEVYVDEVCDVIVYDADGTQQIAFTAGYAASAIEVRSSAFTGTDYEFLGTAAGEPVNLKAVLDLWLTTQGAIDWGQSATVQPFIVVTNAPYSATGDGTTDDTSAIQAALAAAGSGSASPLVFFPEGTYRVTDTLTMLPDVVMFGAGVTIQMNHASNTLLSVGTGRVFGLNLTTTGTGTLVDSTGKTQLSQCTLEGKGKIVSASDVLRLDTCELTASNFSDGEEFIELTAANAEAHAAGCTFVAPTGGYTPASGAMVTGNNLYFSDCTFDASNTSSGTFSYVQFNTAIIMGAIHGCVFGAAAGATVTAMELGAYAGTSRFYETGNAIPTGVTIYSYTASVNTSGVQLGSRIGRILRIDDNSATVAIPTDQYETIIVTSTHASPVMTGTLPPFGARGTVIFYHPSGGAGTAQPTTNFFGSTAATTANTSTHAWEYVCARSNTALRMLVVIDGKALGNGAP